MKPLDAEAFDRGLAKDMKRIQRLLNPRPSRLGRAVARRDGAAPVFESDPRAALARALGVMPTEDRSREVTSAAYALASGFCVELTTPKQETAAIAIASLGAALAGRAVVVLASDERSVGALSDRIQPAAEKLGVPLTIWKGDASETQAPWRAGSIVLSSLQSAAQWQLRTQKEQKGEPTARRPLVLVSEIDTLQLDPSAVTVTVTDTSTAEHQTIENALDLAVRLRLDTDAARDDDGNWQFTDAAERMLMEHGDRLGSLWRVHAYRNDMVIAALAVLHEFKRGEHYHVHEKTIIELPPGPSRAGALSRYGARPFLELKEKLQPQGVPRVVARGRRIDLLRAIGDLAGPTTMLHDIAPELASGFQPAVSYAAGGGGASSPPILWMRSHDQLAARAIVAIRDASAPGDTVVFVAEGMAVLEPFQGALTAAGIEHKLVGSSLSAANEESLKSQVLLARPEAALALAHLQDRPPTVAILLGVFANVSTARKLRDAYRQEAVAQPPLHISCLDDPIFGHLQKRGRMHLALIRFVWPLTALHHRARRLAALARVHALRKQARLCARQQEAERQFEKSLAFTGMTGHWP